MEIKRATCGSRRDIARLDGLSYTPARLRFVGQGSGQGTVSRFDCSQDRPCPGYTQGIRSCQSDRASGSLDSSTRDCGLHTGRATIAMACASNLPDTAQTRDRISCTGCLAHRAFAGVQPP